MQMPGLSRLAEVRTVWASSRARRTVARPGERGHVGRRTGQGANHAGASRHHPRRAREPRRERRRAAPYPASDLITGVSWDTATYQYAGVGGDIWPVTAGADGRSTPPGATARWPAPPTSPTASPPSPAARAPTSSAPAADRSARAGKLISLLDVAGTLFAVAYLQGRPDTRAVAVWSSPDHGRTWRKPGPTFPGTAGTLQPASFVQFGPGYAGARDGYVYLTATKAGAAPRAFYLMRVPRAGLGEAPYEYFAGTAAAPAWGGPGRGEARVRRPEGRERPGRGLRRGPGPVPGDGRARRRRQRRGRAGGVRGARRRGGRGGPSSTRGAGSASGAGVSSGCTSRALGWRTAGGRCGACSAAGAGAGHAATTATGTT